MRNALTLFLMSEKGYEVLKAVVASAGPSIAAVVSARDPNVEKDFYDEIRTFCDVHRIRFFDRGDQPAVDTYALAVSWRWLIGIPPDRLIVLHDSLLPRYRGYNPLVTALINGDEQIGVSAVFGAHSYDCGDVIGQLSAPISYPIRIQDAVTCIARLAGQLGATLAMTIAAGETLTGVPQDEARATYSLWRDEKDYAIDWARPAADVRRFIDAVGFPYRGASSRVNDRLVRVRAADAFPDRVIENRAAGKVLTIDAGRPVVVCGRGVLRIDELLDDATGESLLPWPRIRSRFE
jgi:methionyl-tRNA formyltransferase